MGNYPHCVDKEAEQGFKCRGSDSRPLWDLIDALYSWACVPYSSEGWDGSFSPPSLVVRINERSRGLGRAAWGSHTVVQ